MSPLTGKRVGLLTASASRLGGGVFEAVTQQAALIRSLGGEAPVFALRDRFSDDDASRFAPGTVRHFSVVGPRQIGFAPELLEGLIEAELDCLHLHGIWMYPSRAGGQWAHRTGRPYFVSPHGMLDPWITARGRWKKALARRGYERASWRSAVHLHALTDAEAADIAAETGRADSLVIPNPAPAVRRAVPAGRTPECVYIGRIHPKKNLLALIEAWRMAQRPPEARLTLAGWGDAADVAALEAAVAEAGPSVCYAGPVFGAAKQALLDRARFTVLPSLSEGLPMAILDGWASGTPAIMTAQCHLPEGFAAGAALECGQDPQSIARSIERALTLDPASWAKASQAATTLALGPFSASNVAASWGAAYRGDAMPAEAPCR